MDKHDHQDIFHRLRSPQMETAARQGQLRISADVYYAQTPIDRLVGAASIELI